MLCSLMRTRGRFSCHTILVILKNLLTIDAAQHDVVNSGAAFLSCLSWHNDLSILFYNVGRGVVKKKGTRE